MEEAANGRGQQVVLYYDCSAKYATVTTTILFVHADCWRQLMDDDFAEGVGAVFWPFVFAVVAGICGVVCLIISTLNQ